MPVLLVHLCNSDQFNDLQKSFFWKHVLAVFSENPYVSTRHIASTCLSELWEKYDTGGISAGRSLRAVILEQAMVLVNSGYPDDAEALLAILVAMYHSREYINSHGWFDFEVEAGCLPMGERVILCTAVIALGIRNIPTIEECTNVYIWEEINKGKEKMRVLQKTD